MTLNYFANSTGGKEPPKMSQTPEGWTYTYRAPGHLTSSRATYPTYHDALKAALKEYCDHNTKWRYQNKIRTYRQAAEALGIPTDPPSKVAALRDMRERR